MLSHSSSSANDSRRNQRAQSIQRRPSVNSLIDPVAAKQHALVAATLAYERGHDRENARQRSECQPAQQLERRRSCRTSGFEGPGSHFRENSSSRRQTSKKVANETNASNPVARSRRGTMSSSGVEAIDCAVAAQRKGLLRMPSVDTIQQLGFKKHRSSISVHKLRKAKSICGPSDHVRAGSIDDISFGPPTYPPPLPPPLEETTISQGVFEVDETVTQTLAPIPLTRTNLQSIATNPNVSQLEPITEKEVHARKVRHRASLMLTPFKKRKDKALPSISPPICTPSNIIVASSNTVWVPATQPEVIPRINKRRGSSERKKSESITSRIRSVFRRPSATAQELPVQQVSASRAYFGDHWHAAESNYHEPLQQRTPRSFSHNLGRSTDSSAHSERTTTTKSRVTSWADSTIAGTTIEDQLLAVIEEEYQPVHLSAQKDRKHSSFNLFRRMHRSSRADMQPSEDSDLEHKPITNSTSSLSRKASAAWESLPSQIKKSATNTKSTVRAISPEDLHIALSPVSASSLSSETTPMSDPFSEDMLAVRGRQNTRDIQPVMERATTPNADQIAARIRKSNERWQEPLEGCRSLFYPRSPNSTSPERLSRQMSEKQHSRPERHSSPEDVFAEIREPPSSRSMDVISPSIYSEDGDALDNIHSLLAHHRTPEPIGGSGSAVIITSHQVATYSVGSPKKPEVFQAPETSRDWRNWLQTEVQDLGTPPPDGLKLNDELVGATFTSDHRREESEHDGTAVIVDKPEETALDLLPSSVLPSIEWRPNQPPRLNQHASESSVPSSNDSIRSRLQSNPSLSQGPEDEVGSSPSLASDGHRHSSRSRPRKMSSRPGPDDRPSSRLHDIHEGPALADRPSSRMNERFPFIDTSRPASRASRQSSTPAQSMHSFSSRPTVVQKVQSASEKNKENSTPSPTQGLPIKPTQPRRVMRRPISSLALQRSQSSLAQYTTNESAIISNPASTSSQKSSSHIPRPTIQSPHGHQSSPQIRTRETLRENNSKYTSLPAIETDETLANIVKGPYSKNASPRPLSIRKATTFSRENSPLKESRPATPRDEGVPVTPTSGQRLAEQFLNARRFREEMKVVSPGGMSVTTNASGSEFSPVFL